MIQARFINKEFMVEVQIGLVEGWFIVTMIDLDSGNQLPYLLKTTSREQATIVAGEWLNGDYEVLPPLPTADDGNHLPH